MRYRNLGSSGLKLSAVGLGSWLTFGTAVEADGARACIHKAFELGVNFFDTANEYGQGAAEEAIGKAISDLPRHELVIATKVYWPMGDGPNDWGLSRKHILREVDQSMRRLGVDFIDIYQCHRFDPHVPLEETCQAMNDLVRMGKILYWGVSEWTAEQLLECVSLCRREGWTPPVSNQPQYSALWRTIERKILPATESLGLGTVVFSPLAMGILTGKYETVDDIPPDSRGAGPSFAFISENDTWQDMPYFNAPTLAAVQSLIPTAEKAGCSLAQLALAWILRQPGVTSVITGARRPEQVEHNVKAADLDLEPAFIDAVTETLRPVADFTSATAPNMDS